MITCTDDSYILETVTKPFKISAKMKAALEYVQQGHPVDIAAQKAGLKYGYFRDMFTMYNKHEIKLSEEKKQINTVKKVLSTCATKDMTQEEACVMLNVNFSSFKRWYRKYRRLKK